MEAQVLLNVRQVAGRLGIGRSFTYRLIQTGAIPSVKVGGARRVLVADLDEYVRRLSDEQPDDAA